MHSTSPLPSQRRLDLNKTPSLTVVPRLRQEALSGLAAEERRAATGVKEQVLALRNILDVDLRTAVGLGKNAVCSPSVKPCLGASQGGGSTPFTKVGLPCGSQQLQAVPHADADTVFRDFVDGGVRD